MVKDATRPDLRVATLEAAARLLAVEGPSGLAVRRIAAEAGCSTMAVYHYFDGKQGLIEAIWTEGHTRLAQAQERHRSTADPETDVRSTCLAYREFAIAHPSFFQIMFGHPAHGTTRPTGTVRAPARDNYAQFVAVVARWGERAPLITGAAAAAHALWACGHGLVMLELTRNGPAADPAERYATAIDALMRGLVSTAVPERA